jgi:hypothetical protein
MARRKNPAETVKVHPSMNPASHAHLEELVGFGYGNTATEVARYLIQKGLDELLQSGLIGPGTKRRVTRVRASTGLKHRPA